MRIKITLTKEAQRLLTSMKKKMHPKIRRTWLSEWISNELLKQFYHKTKEELELEAIRFEAAKLNGEKRVINGRLHFLSEESKILREKIEDGKKK